MKPSSVAMILLCLGCSANPAPPADIPELDGDSPGGTSANPELEARCDAGDLDACVEFGNQLHLSSFPSREYTALTEGPEHTKAFKLYSKACAGGNGRGCNMAGGMLQQGAGVPSDKPRAREYLSLGCRAGNAAACYNLGFALAIGDGVPADPGASIHAFDSACKRGVPDACTAAALIFDRGLAGTTDRGRAQEYLRLTRSQLGRSCDTNASTCVSYAETALEADFDVDAAKTILSDACHANNAEGCLILARTSAQPRPLLEKACSLEDRCFSLAEAYREGVGVPKNPERAAKLYARACAAREWEACAFAGPKDQTRDGLHFVRKRCRQLKDPQACRVLEAYEERAVHLESR